MFFSDHHHDPNRSERRLHKNVTTKFPRAITIQRKVPIVGKKFKLRIRVQLQSKELIGVFKP